MAEDKTTEELIKLSLRYDPETGELYWLERPEESFQAGKKKLLILNYIAGGFGLTLTSGHTAMCVELDWNPTTLAQAAGRFRRIGQKKTVNIYYFPTIKSIDEHVINVVRSKMSAFNKVM